MIYCIPTDTCYWLACPLSDEAGYRAIYTIKGRDFTKPLAQVVETFDAIKKYARITNAQISFLRQYPHPFTLLATPRDGAFPDFINPHRTEFALRVAESCIRPEVWKLLNFPIFLTSANRSGEKECATPEECRRFLDRTDASYTILGDAKIIVCNPPSNIFSFVGDSTRIVYQRKNYGSFDRDKQGFR